MKLSAPAFTTRSPANCTSIVAGAWLSAGLALVLTACSGGSAPVPLPPQTVTGGAADPSTPQLVKELPSEVAANERQAAPAVTADPPSAEPSSVTVVGSGNKERREDDDSLLILGQHDGAPGETTNRDLVEASRRERERRRTTQPIVVIDDENLAQAAQGGSLTVGSPRTVDPEELEEARATLDEYASKEQYWRDRAREIRVRFREAFDSIDRLQAEATEWRRKFYAAEDIALREREIKPAWNRAQNRVMEARNTLDNVQAELDLLYEEGRFDGALDGWLREGIELEPWPDELEEAERKRKEWDSLGTAPPSDERQEPPPE